MRVSPVVFPLAVAVLALPLLSCDKGHPSRSASPASSSTARPPLKLKLECEKTTFSRGEHITLWLRIDNLGPGSFMAWDAIWESVLVFDGKEFKRLPKYIRAWNGPGRIDAGSMFGSAMGLTPYGVTQEHLTAGKHTVAYKIWASMSNVLTLAIVENTANQGMKTDQQ